MSVPLTLMHRFEKYAVKESLITSGMKLVIAISGGADSVALLHLLNRLKTKFHLSLIAVHVNHHMRKDESDADEQFVTKLCNELNINTVIKHLRMDIKTDIENQMRIKRIDILHKILKSYRFDYIALAHNKNDQAETVLMNFSRGSGITGMGGIKTKTDSIIRPLLFFSRAEIEEWLMQNNIKWRHDQSNDDMCFTRNRIRHELIPWFELNMNQSLVHRIHLQARIFQQTDEYLKKLSRKRYKRALIEDNNEFLVLDLDYLKQLADIEQFYLLRLCYSNLSKTEHEFFMTGFNEIRNLFHSDGSKQTELPHKIWVLKQYNELIFTSINPQKEIDETHEFIISEEKTHFVFLNKRFSLKYLKMLPKNKDVVFHKNTVYIDLNKVVMPLYLKTRKEGDRFIPTGMKSEKRLKEFFIDEKVPKLERDKVPILADQEKIIWIVGYRLDERAVCDSNSNKILQISIEPVTAGRKRAASRAFVNKEGKYDIHEL